MIREEVIAQLIAGKDVLDIGSIGQSGEYRLWDTIVAESASVVGVDLPEAVEVARTTFNLDEAELTHQKDVRIVAGNMETVALDKKFDVAIAGDVIEHVSNQGLFLDNIARHLKADGKLLITTPNAKWPTVFLRPNPTHTLWHDQYTLTHLLKRHGFRVESLRYYCGNKPYYNPVVKLLAYHQGILVIAGKA